VQEVLVDRSEFSRQLLIEQFEGSLVTTHGPNPTVMPLMRSGSSDPHVRERAGAAALLDEILDAVVAAVAARACLRRLADGGDSMGTVVDSRAEFVLGHDVADTDEHSTSWLGVPTTG
jgi:hypothetical protein